MTRRGLTVTFAALVLTALLVLGSALAAQTVLGKSAIEGRVVELLSDGTWRYSDPEQTAEGCQQLPLGLAFCGRGQGWTQVDPPSPEIAAQYFFDDRHYGQYVIEEIGTDDGLTSGFFRKIVIENAASAGGISPAEVSVVAVEEGALEGHPTETIIYQLPIDGLEVIFSNTIVVTPKKSLQAMTFSIGTTMSEKHRDLHAQFLGHTRLN